LVSFNSLLFDGLPKGIKGAFNFGISISFNDDVVERNSVLLREEYDVFFH